ncbi:hypothetical protein Hdeb2414_s0209g00833191 [Helianthus debilis subsp. tardiflorus]
MAFIFYFILFIFFQQLAFRSGSRSICFRLYLYLIIKRSLGENKNIVEIEPPPSVATSVAAADDQEITAW